MTYEKLIATFGRRGFCVRCADSNIGTAGSDRYSMGVYAGRYCEPCWEQDGRNHDRPFDPMDAGEAFGEDDY
jgi:hypothetical protein